MFDFNNDFSLFTLVSVPVLVFSISTILVNNNGNYIEENQIIDLDKR